MACHAALDQRTRLVGILREGDEIAIWDTVGRAFIGPGQAVDRDSGGQDAGAGTLTGGGVTTKGMAEVAVWWVVVMVRVVVERHLCSVCVVVAVFRTVDGARSEAHALERVGPEQVVREVGVTGLLRLSIIQEGPL